MSSNAAQIHKPDVPFDEAWYLSAYPDVAKAVRDRVFQSGYGHYIECGRMEGRLPCAFDEKWYAKSYPVAVADAGGADERALRSHYLNIGRFRGYRPSAQAVRPKNAAGISSPFGGLWLDHLNAEDLIAGKYEIGRISKAEASLLRSYVRDGYVVLSGEIPSVIVDRAEEALENAFAGKIGELQFECHNISKTHCRWAPGVKDNPAKALDIHWWSEEIRNIIFCEPAKRALQLIFERAALASQTLGFYRGSGQPLHQDSAYVAYTLPLQFAASWIALEDVAAGAGELEYLVGSHRKLPEYTYPGGYKSTSESVRYGVERAAVSRAVASHEHRILTEGRRRQLKRETFIAKRGDVLLWHADLAHGGSPISLVRSRKSIVTHYCPREVAPLYFENVPALVRKHDASSYYSSGLYTEPGGS